MVKFGEPGWQQYFIKRNREIMVLVDQGRTLASIAREFGISRPRVEQIKRKELWRRKYGHETQAS